MQKKYWHAAFIISLIWPLVLAAGSPAGVQQGKVWLRGNRGRFTKGEKHPHRSKKSEDAVSSRLEGLSTKESQLWCACRDGDLPEIKRLAWEYDSERAQEGAPQPPVNFNCLFRGQTPLAIAITEDEARSAEWLIKHYYRKNLDGLRIALHAAVGADAYKTMVMLNEDCGYKDCWHTEMRGRRPIDLLTDATSSQVQRYVETHTYPPQSKLFRKREVPEKEREGEQLPPQKKPRHASPPKGVPYVIPSIISAPSLLLLVQVEGSKK